MDGAKRVGAFSSPSANSSKDKILKKLQDYVAFFYSKLRSGKVIRVVDDLWPEVIYERGFFKSKFLQKFLNKLAYFSYDFPQYVLPLTEEAKNHIVKFYKIDPKKLL